MRLPPSGIDPSVGDWLCACGNWNWARRNECNKCMTPHPSRPKLPPSKHDERLNRAVGLDSGAGLSTAERGAKRTGDGGGFREFDEEEEMRRKSRALEDKRETEVRKAAKQKCPYCKRFACIC